MVLSSRFEGMEFADNGAAISPSKAGQFVNLTDCGEGVDVASLQLPEWQLRLLAALHAAKRRIITVIIAGRPYAMDRISQSSDAICYAFYPGPAGGRRSPKYYGERSARAAGYRSRCRMPMASCRCIITISILCCKIRRLPARCRLHLWLWAELCLSGVGSLLPKRAAAVGQGIGNRGLHAFVLHKK